MTGCKKMYFKFYNQIYSIIKIIFFNYYLYLKIQQLRSDNFVSIIYCKIDYDKLRINNKIMKIIIMNNYVALIY